MANRKLYVLSGWMSFNVYIMQNWQYYAYLVCLKTPHLTNSFYIFLPQGGCENMHSPLWCHKWEQCLTDTFTGWANYLFHHLSLVLGQFFQTTISAGSYDMRISAGGCKQGAKCTFCRYLLSFMTQANCARLLQWSLKCEIKIWKFK